MINKNLKFFYLIFLLFNNMHGHRSKEIDILLKNSDGKEFEACEIGALTILGLNPLVFGLPGTQILELDKKLLKYKIPYFLAKNEAHAVFAAQGYNAVLQIPAFVTVTAGPGIINALSGVYDAYMENDSLILISGNAPLDILKDETINDLQKIDTKSVVKKISKKVISLADHNSFQNCLIEAFKLAIEKPYGPIVIDVPTDLLKRKERFSYFPEIVIEHKNKTINEEVLKNAVNLILHSKKPFIVIGKEILGEQKSVWQFIENIASPFGYSLNAKGILPDDHPQNYGILGVIGRQSSNQALYDSDLVIIIGNYGDINTFPNKDYFTKGKKIIINSSKKNRIEADIFLEGDIKTICEQLSNCINRKDQQKKLLNWNKTIKKEFMEEKFYDSNKNGISPIKAFEILNKHYNPDIFIADVGENRQHAAKLMELKANIYNKNSMYGNTSDRFIDSYKKQIVCSSGPAATMGTAISLTFGAHLANKKAKLLTIVGDGSFEMHLSSLWLLAANNVPSACVIMNNLEYGEMDEYKLNRKKDYIIKTTKLKMGPLGIERIPNFEFAAKIYNIDYYKATNYAELSQFTKKIRNFNKPYLFEILVYPLASYPHIPINGTIKDIVEKP